MRFRIEDVTGSGVMTGKSQADRRLEAHLITVTKGGYMDGDPR